MTSATRAVLRVLSGGLIAGAVAVAARQAPATDEWASYGHDPGGMR